MSVPQAIVDKLTAERDAWKRRAELLAESLEERGEDARASAEERDEAEAKLVLTPAVLEKASKAMWEHDTIWKWERESEAQRIVTRLDMRAALLAVGFTEPEDKA